MGNSRAIVNKIHLEDVPLVICSFCRIIYYPDVKMIDTNLFFNKYFRCGVSVNTSSHIILSTTTSS